MAAKSSMESISSHDASIKHDRNQVIHFAMVLNVNVTIIECHSSFHQLLASFVLIIDDNSEVFKQ